MIAVPSAYSFAFAPTNQTQNIMVWMLSTKFMPAVGALLPVYLIFQWMDLLDSRLALIIVFTMSNLPIMVWMLYSNFKDIPKEVIMFSDFME